MGNCWGSPKKVTNHNSQSTICSNLETANDDNRKGKAVVDNGKSPARGGGGGEEASVPLPPPTAWKPVVPTLKIYTLAELKSATRNFRPDTVLGEGGFGRVFKGWVDEKTYAPSKVGVGIPVAVKKSNPDSSQGLQEWQAEVKILSKYSHPNLVKLIGYCWEEKQFLLVYEYMQRGSLENHLFGRTAEPLSWDVRLKIAIGAAKGLAFLHTSEKSVIYRDFKSSNILLDLDFSAKLSDFGLAKLGPANGNSHVTTRIVGTYGYAAPEYVATGHLYVRSDVFGFGVVLLEMLTGLQALDTNRRSGEQNLVDWARPFLSDKRKLKKIMDPGLENQCTTKTLLKTAELILNCLEGDPKNRPPMDKVLGTLEEISAMSRTKPNSTPERPTRRRDESSSSTPFSRNHHKLPHHHCHNYHHHQHARHGGRSH